MAKKHFHKKNTNFDDPQKGFDSTTKRTVVLVAVLILIVMFASYFIIVYKYGSVSNMFLGETKESTTKQTTTLAPVKNVNGSQNILISLNSAGETNAYAFFLVNFDMTKNITTATSIPINTVDSTGKTLSEEYSLGGVTQVEYSLEKLFGININNYVSATQNGYKYMLSELGDGVKYNIEQDVQFSTTDFSLSIEQGNQTLSFDYFMKLLRFTDWQGAENETYNQQAKLILAVREQLFVAKNVKRDVDRFDELTTYIKTDISSENYADNLDTAQYIASTKMVSKVVVPQGKFSGSGEKETFKYSSSSVSKITTAFSQK